MSEARRFADLSGSYTLGYEYNFANQVKTVSNQSAGTSFGYVIDNAGRLSTVTSTGLGASATLASNARYRASSALRQLQYGNATQMNLAYNSRGLIAQYSLSSRFDGELKKHARILNNSKGVKGEPVLAILCLCIMMCTTAVAQAIGWRGLVPLHSTRADVERLLGSPTEVLSTYSTFYRTASETVIVSYANGLPCGIGEKYSQWRVPANTIENILVTPLKGFPVSQLSIDQTKFEKRSGGHRPEDTYYINDQDGESIRVYLGDVMIMSFYPSRIDAHLGCSASQASNKNCEGLTSPAVDSFGKVSEYEARLHLDSFGIALLGDRTRTGYIVTYAGKRAAVDEARKWAERARNYLISVRGLPVVQLIVIDGGYREAPTMELYIVEPNACSPIPNPTVDPRDVQIIKGGKAKSNRSSSRPIQLRKR